MQNLPYYVILWQFHHLEGAFTDVEVRVGMLDFENFYFLLSHGQRQGHISTTRFIRIDSREMVLYLGDVKININKDCIINPVNIVIIL